MSIANSVQQKSSAGNYKINCRFLLFFLLLRLQRFAFQTWRFVPILYAGLSLTTGTRFRSDIPPSGVQTGQQEPRQSLNGLTGQTLPTHGSAIL